MSSHKYSLKPIEVQLLKVITDQQANMLSNTLSFIAIERLNETITAETKFDISEDLTEITITQPETEAPEAEIVTEAPKKGRK